MVYTISIRRYKVQTGTSVYINYKGSQCYAEVVGYEYPYYIVRLTSGLELRVYEDELKEV